jgi:nitrogen fixation/metabolism regulation signal transduction histidine kinase
MGRIAGVTVRDADPIVTTNTEGRVTPSADSLRRIAHDLRAPLNAMRLSLDLLRRSLDREDAGDEACRALQLKQIERLDRQIDAMSELIANAAERASPARARAAR